ncbi:hypothetical protein RJ639_005374 [Escallonia herrerae]|uniref:Uncharacterized protein n=1 Tax=Escallonia herrerae TaxID=1293975 RepID=A0AA88VUY1_9ASTE|nr:hypothetical protein RJ639_005374 [Escallonia herrerae]
MAGSLARNPVTEEALHSSITKIIKDYSDNKAQPSSNASIYRVPQKLRKLKESDYTPLIVSIGPYHKHDERLKDMEDQKKSYTSSLLSRVIEPGQTTDAAIKEITNKILDKAADARSCYTATHELDDDARFAEMLLVDGCFILELLYRRQKADHPQKVGGDRQLIGDPILGDTAVFLDVRRDLLLLENQIPMFVLQTLFEFSLVQLSTLPDLIINFFGNMLNVKLRIRKVAKTKTAAHILGLLHDCYLPYYTTALERKNTNHQIIKHFAGDLDRAGVDFKEGKGRDQMCVNFSTSCRFSFLGGTSHRGTTESRRCCYSWFFQLCGRTSFEIPKLCLYDSTEPFLRNLIAFEQCSPSISHHITSYAFLMDALIRTEKDVKVLVKAGVLENQLSTSGNARLLFNSLRKEVALGEFTFLPQWRMVEDYCDSYESKNVKRNWAELKRYYFSNRWAFISVIAAFTLFTLQVIQTIYTVRSFY